MPGGVELRLEFGVEDFLEQVLEAAVIGLQDRVLGRQVHRPAEVEAIVESRRGRSRGSNRRGCTSPWRRRAREVEHVEVDLLAVVAVPHHAQLAGAGDQRVGGAILVAERRDGR
jgi:hypothetical protein